MGFRLQFDDNRPFDPFSGLKTLPVGTQIREPETRLSRQPNPQRRFPRTRKSLGSRWATGACRQAVRPTPSRDSTTTMPRMASSSSSRCDAGRPPTAQTKMCGPSQLPVKYGIQRLGYGDHYVRATHGFLGGCDSIFADFLSEPARVGGGRTPHANVVERPHQTN